MKYKLTEDEYNLATFYSECRKFTKNDVEKMKLLLRTHLDPKINICSHCKAQVAYAQRKVIYLLENSVVKRECNICKNDISDMHYNTKYCSDECRNKK